MVSSKRTGGLSIRWFHRRTPRREKETCRTTAPLNSFIDSEGARERYRWFHRRTPRREETGNSPRTAEYAWHFTCNLQPRRNGEYLFLSQSDFVWTGQSKWKGVSPLRNPARQRKKWRGPTKSKSSTTIYNSINHLLPPPSPRDRRPRDWHISLHPVPPSGASWSLPRAASITRQYTTQSIICGLFLRRVTLVRTAGILGMSCPSWQWHRIGNRWFPVRTLPVAPLPPSGASWSLPRAVSVLRHAACAETPRPLPRPCGDGPCNTSKSTRWALTSGCRSLGPHWCPPRPGPCPEFRRAG